MYRVRVVTHLEELFEVDAETDGEAAEVWFDGHLVGGSGGQAEVASVELIDRAESGVRWSADRAAGAL